MLNELFIVAGRKKAKKKKKQIREGLEKDIK